ncbi:MAG: EAL domain-containing protein, partial [Firmicutes bacterium]|nr:EAL domain-containing protein [Bacillota bacterium]
IYDKNVSLSEFKSDSFNEEIDVMIRDNKLNYQYRPVLDVHNISNFGYFSYVKTLSSLFSSINEAKEYARQSTRNQDKDLFDAISNKVIPDFVAQRDGAYLKLFFAVLMSERPFIIQSLSRISHIKEANLILTFDEEDLVSFTMENEATIPELMKFKDAGYEIAVILANKDLLLASDIYAVFDYFVVDSRMTTDINKNNRRRANLHTLCDKLVHYKKPIIATDLENWNSVELMTKSGINLVSSNVISESDPMLLPFDRKKILKVKSFSAVSPQ